MLSLCTLRGGVSISEPRGSGSWQGCGAPDGAPGPPPAPTRPAARCDSASVGAAGRSRVRFELQLIIWRRFHLTVESQPHLALVACLPHPPGCQAASGHRPATSVIIRPIALLGRWRPPGVSAAGTSREGADAAPQEELELTLGRVGPPTLLRASSSANSRSPRTHLNTFDVEHLQAITSAGTRRMERHSPPSAGLLLSELRLHEPSKHSPKLQPHPLAEDRLGPPTGLNPAFPWPHRP